METTFPEGFQERFFTVSSSNVPETLRRIGSQIYVPCGMKHTVVEVPVDESDPSKGTKEEDRYSWIGCTIPFQGDDLSDQAAFELKRYGDLRAYFYASSKAQDEMDKDSEKFKHFWAVQIMFPKQPGILPAEYVKYRKYKQRFWWLIKNIVESKGHSFEDEVVPLGFFNADDMYNAIEAWGCTQEELITLSMQVMALTLNMIANHAQYVDFFPFEPGDLTFHYEAPTTA